MSENEIQVKPVAGALGAEIRGVDMARPLGNRTFKEIHDALMAHQVIFFRDQTLTPEQHITFAERWGPINVNRFFTPVEGYPQIAQVLKEPHHDRNVGSLDRRPMERAAVDHYQETGPLRKAQ